MASDENEGFTNGISTVKNLAMGNYNPLLEQQGKCLVCMDSTNLSPVFFLARLGGDQNIIERCVKTEIQTEIKFSFKRKLNFLVTLFK